MALDFLIFRRHSEDLDGLKKFSLFEGLSRQELKIVAGLLHTREYLAGEVVFDEGELGQAIYLLLKGQVTICRQGNPEDGHLATLGAGKFFGELGLLVYYALHPIVRALTHRGLARDKAAALVMFSFLALAVLLIALAPPRVIGQAADWHISADRYMQGGIRFLRGCKLH